ncbi:hypothetical protein ACA910_021371 [Epithemia clementina (nom. ined.)]
MAETQTAKAIVQHYVNTFHSNNYQDPLQRLTNAWKSSQQNVELWAKKLYLTLRDDPLDENARQLNMDRKHCLNLLYHLVDDWKHFPSKDEFEQEMFNTFEPWRMRAILYICLPMDRAQSLYKMRIFASPLIGMHWFSKTHLKEGTVYALEFPQEHEELCAAVDPEEYQGSATMNHRIYKLLHTPRFGLLAAGGDGAAELAHWSRPAWATFVPIP